MCQYLSTLHLMNSRKFSLLSEAASRLLNTPHMVVKMTLSFLLISFLIFTIKNIRNVIRRTRQRRELLAGRLIGFNQAGLPPILPNGI